MPRIKKQPVKTDDSIQTEEPKPVVPDLIGPVSKRKKKDPNDLKTGEIIVKRGHFFVKFD
jgi:hypothetical protein